MQLRPIDIDIEVHRIIEMHRASFAETPNDILRRILLLEPSNGEKPKQSSAAAVSGDWSWKGVTLPAGTELRMTYNGRTHEGLVSGGAWQIGGAIYNSPSSAADALARSRDGKHVSLNGWVLWEVKKPGEADWVLLDSLRPTAFRASRSSSRIVTVEELKKRAAHSA